MKVNKKRKLYMYINIATLPPYIILYVDKCNAESKKSSTKGQLGEKMRVLCWSILLLVYGL